jgi:hypothetical protein
MSFDLTTVSKNLSILKVTVSKNCKYSISLYGKTMSVEIDQNGEKSIIFFSQRIHLFSYFTYR